MAVNQGLTLDTNDPIYKLIVETPDFGSNPVGKVARAVLVNKLKAASSGEGTQFRDLFFPHYDAVSYERDVVAMTDLSDGWWSDFSAAVLCQSMYRQTSILKPKLLSDKINASVDSYNGSLKWAAVQWYSHVLLLDFMKYSGDKAAAKKVYIDQICTPTWVTFKMKQYNDGTWNNPEWEEFHHWAKLSALGASDGEIFSVIYRLQGLGLRIFPTVDANLWRNYLVWYSPDAIDHNDVDSEARYGELKGVVVPNPTGSSSYEPEYYSFEFTSISPANQYRYSPSSCCFSPTTRVLLPDGSTKEICKIRGGDMVQTPSGPRKVLLVSTPMRNGRTLYGVNQLPGFSFTATHPFRNGKHDGVLSVSPRNLVRTVPLIGYEGVGVLENGMRLLRFQAGVYVPYQVESVQEFPSNIDDELLYDLILEPDASGLFEYIVGTEGCLLVVASELPPFKSSTTAERLAGLIILSCISTASQELEMCFSLQGQRMFSIVIDRIALRLSANLVPHSSSLMSGTCTIPELNLSNLADFTQCALGQMKMFSSSDGAYNPATGEAFAYLSERLCHQLASSLQLGYRTIRKQTDCDTVAVSLLDLQIVASRPHLSLSSPTISVHLDDQPPPQHVINTEGAPFGVRIHKTFYFQHQEVNEHRLEVRIRTDQGILHASTYIVLPLLLNYRHYRLSVVMDEEERGILEIDIRYLSEADVIEEKKARTDWDEKGMIDLAQLYANTGGELLKQQLCVAK